MGARAVDRVDRSGAVLSGGASNDLDFEFAALADFAAARHQSARPRRHPPHAVLPLQADQMIGRALARGFGGRRSRGHADDRDAAAQSPGGGRFQMRDRPLVIMAVQDQFGAVARDDGLEFARVGQVAHRGCARKQRGMMNEDDARQSAPPRFVEQPGEPMELVLADVPRRHQRPRRHAGRQADQRDIVAHAQKRVAAGRLDPRIAGRPRREQRRQIGHRAMRIGVVIARREADVGGRPERVHPRGGRRKFGRQPDVHDIAGHRDVIGPLTAQIGDEARATCPYR